jgi:hypothetical protein
MLRKHFYERADRTSPYSLTADMRDGQFSSLLAAGFCVGVACTRLTRASVLFPFTCPPSCRFVASQSNLLTPLLHHSRFLPNPFKFITHESVYYSMIYDFDVSASLNEPQNTEICVHNTILTLTYLDIFKSITKSELFHRD